MTVIMGVVMLFLKDSLLRSVKRKSAEIELHNIYEYEYTDNPLRSSDQIRTITTQESDDVSVEVSKTRVEVLEDSIPPAYNIDKQGQIEELKKENGEMKEENENKQARIEELLNAIEEMKKKSKSEPAVRSPSILATSDVIPANMVRTEDDDNGDLEDVSQHSTPVKQAPTDGAKHFLRRSSVLKGQTTVPESGNFEEEEHHQHVSHVFNMPVQHPATRKGSGGSGSGSGSGGGGSGSNSRMGQVDMIPEGDEEYSL